jgi:hypothetical protein
MKRRKKRMIVAALACFAALAFVGSAVGMPMVDTGSGGSTSPTAVRPDDRAGMRGVVYAQVPQALGSSLRGEHSFGANQPVQLQPASSGSDYNWGRTIAVSSAAVALALALVGLTIGGMRQRKPLHA